jgi:hypothetical protein
LKNAHGVSEEMEAPPTWGKLAGIVQAAEPYVTYEDYLAAEQAGTTSGT